MAETRGPWYLQKECGEYVREVAVAEARKGCRGCVSRMHMNHDNDDDDKDGGRSREGRRSIACVWE